MLAGALSRLAADRTLAGARYLQLLDALHALLVDPPLTELAATPAGPVLADAVRRTGKRLRRRIAVARDEQTGGALHEVRKAAKRVRYAAESVSDVYGSKASKLAAAMEDAQETLGEHQDTVVIRGVLRRLGDDAVTAGESSFSYGRLHALEQVRGEDAKQAYLKSTNSGSADPPNWLH